MFLPLRDAPEEPGPTAWMNPLLIGVNVLVHVLLVARHGAGAGFDAVLSRWGFTPADPTVLQMGTSLFLHAGWLHLAGNMLFLWILGDNVEKRMGPLPYLLAYLTFGFTATLLFLALDPHAATVCVGASGAIFGVAGFYWVAFPRNRVQVLLFFGVVWAPWIRARWVLGLYFVLDFLNMVVRRVGAGAEAGGVAYAAHVGGFLGGLILGLLAWRFGTTPAPRQPPAGGGEAVARGEQALAAGHVADAERWFRQVIAGPATAPERVHAARRLAHLRAVHHGDRFAARELLRLALSQAPDAQVRADLLEDLARLDALR